MPVGAWYRVPRPALMTKPRGAHRGMTSPGRPSKPPARVAVESSAPEDRCVALAAGAASFVTVIERSSSCGLDTRRSEASRRNGAMDGLNDRLGVIDLEHEPLVALAAELDYDRLGRVPQIPERPFTVADEAAGDDEAWELCSEQPPARRACCERWVHPGIDDMVSAEHRVAA